MGEQIVNAYFEPADNRWVELDANKTTEEVDFGLEVRLTAISVSHDNQDYVIVKLRKPEDTKSFWKHKFSSGLNGQLFLQPIPKKALTKVIVEIEPKEGSTIDDSVIVNLSYI